MTRAVSSGAGAERDGEDVIQLEELDDEADGEEPFRLG